VDDINTIAPLQSATIRAALKAIALNAVTLLTLATGKAFDIDAIQDALDYGVTMAINAASIWYGYKAIRARMNATAVIKKE
jgi:hypothetical protein